MDKLQLKFAILQGSFKVKFWIIDILWLGINTESFQEHEFLVKVAVVLSLI